MVNHVLASELLDVTGVQFGILSPEEIGKMSVVHDGQLGKLSNLRLGPKDTTTLCLTCSRDLYDCPGHFGHLKLGKPMFHIVFMKTVLWVLRCVCYCCSQILAEEAGAPFRKALKIKNPKFRLKKIMLICKKKCLTCKMVQPKFSIDADGIQMMIKEGKEKERDFTASEALIVLKRISNDNCQRLGFDTKFTRPDWMILENLPIPPPHVRPSLMINKTNCIENDLTHMLNLIIRHNNKLKKHIADGSSELLISQASRLLQFHLAAYFDNKMPKLPRITSKSERVMESLCCRLKGKTGRVRENLMGKRVGSSARTVITPDPTLNIDEVGVPLRIALELTYTERVTKFNIQSLQKLVDNGPYPPPGKTGALRIVSESGGIRNLKLAKDNKHVLLYNENSWLQVERHLRDGDLVMLNRLPTLHRMSIMGHRVRIRPYSTFGLNISAASPYNADFDGDEMTMHVPQSAETVAEVSGLMMVPKCIVSPQANRPVIGIVQDTLLGCGKITKRDTFIEKDMLMNMLMLKEDWDKMVPVPAILKPRPRWTGKQIFSVNIPGNINLLDQSAWHSNQETGYITPGDTQVQIEQGILLTGTLCKKTLGTCTGSLVHVIWEDLGPDAAMKFVSNTQRLVKYWLRQHGFTFGVGDIITDSPTKAHISRVISEAKDAVNDLFEKFKGKELRAEMGKTMTETFESMVSQALNVARDDAGNIVCNSLAETNNLKAMVTAGSTKGSIISISQMTACVGQQHVEGKRIPFEFDWRTLPHFAKYDYGAESRGFVKSSYLCGLSPVEFFFHAVGGRDGLIDTAVKVSKTGYMQRRLVKTMEDIIVTYDGTVRNMLGDVIQFLYGEDGMDAVYLESQKLDSLKMKKSEFDTIFKYENWDPPYISAEYRTELQVNEEWHAKIDAEYQQLEADRRLLGTVIAEHGDDTWPFPVNIKRHIRNAQKKFKIGLQNISDKFKIGLQNISDMQPVEIVDAVSRLQKSLLVVNGDDAVHKEAQENATLLFKILLRSTLASKRVLDEYKLSREAFHWVINQIEWKFRQSLVAPGESVGCVAAQSIGEPATQMTLRTVHYAGMGATNLSVGIPRFEELINVAKMIKTPSLSVYLTSDISRSKEEATIVQSALEWTTLESVIQATEIWYDPKQTSTIIKEDLGWVQTLYFPNDDFSALSPWLLRIKLNQNLMVDKSLEIFDIVEKVNRVGGMSCICDEESMILRIRFILSELPSFVICEVPGEDADVVTIKNVEKYLKKYILKGIPEINKVHLKKISESRFHEEDGFKTSDEEWMLVTEGVNLLDVMGKEGVDPTRTTSNHLPEIEKVLGIEAARRVMLNKLQDVISFNGSYVNHRHLGILVDIMTHRGHLTPVTRHGINKNDSRPLMRCSFEETVKTLLEAGVYAELDNLRGVSQSIMLGKLAALGTGIFELIPPDVPDA